jgi:hypothetical protein
MWSSEWDGDNGLTGWRIDPALIAVAPIKHVFFLHIKFQN